MPKIEFYFDFLSPYAYLAHRKLPGIADLYRHEIDYRPIDLKAAKLATGNTSPSTALMPAKLRYAVTDLNRWAARYDVSITMPSSPPQSERANKGALYAIQRGQIRHYVEIIWGETFGQGKDVNDDAVLAGAATRLGWQADAFLAFLSSADAMAAYDESNLTAQDLGVFGVPTIRIGDQMWWGNDRLDMVEEYLASQKQN